MQPEHIPRPAQPLSSSDPHLRMVVLRVHSSFWYHEETETQLRLPQGGDLALCPTILLIVRAKMLCPLQAEVPVSCRGGVREGCSCDPSPS